MKTGGGKMSHQAWLERKDRQKRGEVDAEINVLVAPENLRADWARTALVEAKASVTIKKIIKRDKLASLYKGDRFVYTAGGTTN